MCIFTVLQYTDICICHFIRQISCRVPKVTDNPRKYRIILSGSFVNFDIRTIELSLLLLVDTCYIMENTNINKRAANFSKEECWRLLEIVERYAHVVENKKTDALTWRDKVKLYIVYNTHRI